MARTTRTRAAAKPVEEDDVFEELDELEEAADDDLEELDEPEETKPARGRAKKAAPAAKKTAAKAAPKSESSEYDSNWLASHITEETGVEYDSRGVRMLLRKLAKDGSLDREIGTDRARYTFPKGPTDPTVRAVIKMVKSGEAQAVKREGLENVKAKAAAAPAKKTTTKAAPAKKTTTRRRSAE
jgi:hypothetical protein